MDGCRRDSLTINLSGNNIDKTDFDIVQETIKEFPIHLIWTNVDIGICQHDVSLWKQGNMAKCSITISDTNRKYRKEDVSIVMAENPLLSKEVCALLANSRSRWWRHFSRNIVGFLPSN